MNKIDFIKGAVKLAKAELSIDKASADTIELRKKMCIPCDQNDIGCCIACGGCYIHAKIRLRREFCPDGKW